MARPRSWCARRIRGSRSIWGRASHAFLPFFVRNTGDSEEGFAGAGVIAEPIHAADGVEFFGANVGAFRVDILIFDIDGDDAAKDDA